MTDDSKLLAATKAGDVQAFGQLVDRYHGLVCAVAYSRTGDRTISEDVAQDTFVAAWNGIGELREPDKLRPWLCGIARNLAGKSLRGRRREIAVEAVGEIAGDRGPLAEILDKEAEAVVWAALEQVPETYREPLVLFYREQQSIKEVALGLGLTEDAAKQRLSRGRQSLKQNVEALVERTLASGRPRKGASAAVIAAILALGGAKTAHAAPKTVRRGRTRKIAAVGGATIAIASIAAVIGMTSRGGTKHEDRQSQIANLEAARAAWKSRTGGVATCDLTGQVTRADGSAVSGALVAIFPNTVPTLEPILLETDVDGRWKLPAATGSFAISVSAPGLRARSRNFISCGETAMMLEAATSTLRGTIEDAGGGPIAGALVLLGDSQNPIGEFFIARSATNGYYELSAAPGRYMALAIDEDYVISTRPVTLGPEGARENLRLLPGASIEGTVVDANNAPVAGAKVATVPSQIIGGTDLRKSLLGLYTAMLPVTSDANGRFVIRRLPPGNIQIAAHTATQVTTEPVSVDLTVAENHAEVAVSVSPAHAISGFVVGRDAPGVGIADIKVMALRDPIRPAMPVSATTDGAGYFELGGLTRGTYRIAVLAKGYAPRVSEPVTIIDRAITDDLVVLDRGVSVRGRVEPPGPASVKIRPSTPSLELAMRAGLLRADVDDRGNFTFDAVPPGDYVVDGTTFDRKGEQTVHVGTTAPSEVRVALEPRRAITGQVVDESGAKVAGALVSASRPPSIDLGVHDVARTDENGNFRIIGVTAGTYELRVFSAYSQRPFAGTRKDRELFDPREVEVPLQGDVNERLEVVSGGGHLGGVVVDADNNPVQDAWIDVDVRRARNVPVFFELPPILTDEKGRFSIDGLYGTELVVEATASNARQLAIVKTAMRTDLRIALQHIATLDATVQLEKKPVREFDVRLDKGPADQHKHVRGAAGTLSLATVPGNYELTVTCDEGCARQPLTLVAGRTSTLTLALEPWGHVRGRVVDADGTPWAGSPVHLDDALDPELVRTDNDGYFELRHVNAGKHQLSFMNGREVTNMFFEIKPGAEIDLDTIDARSMYNTKSSASADLGLAFYVSVAPPTPSQIAEAAKDASSATRAADDPQSVLWIATVEPNSPAARAGIKPGDRVIAVGMSTIGSGKAAADELMSLSTPWRSKGRAVRWKVMRGNAELAFDVVVPAS